MMMSEEQRPRKVNYCSVVARRFARASAHRKAGCGTIIPYLQVTSKNVCNRLHLCRGAAGVRLHQC
eukprot:6269787-Amphidinium_carterae.2